MDNNLTNALEEDIEWREGELASFKVAISSTERGSVKESALLRGAWALLYSHYEGFSKFAWDSYLDEIERSNIKVSDCIECISILSMRKRFKTLRGNTSNESLWAFFSQEISALLHEPVRFDDKPEAESNLWPNLFKENAAYLGITPTYIDLYATQIKTLVSRRNQIAHGKKLNIKDREEYFNYEHIILLVMHDLAICLIDELCTNGYQKVAS